MSKIFATTSGKGGVGKSSVATGLGLAFSHLGHRVLLVDMDEGLRCLDLLLGVEGEAVLDLSDALTTPDISDIAYPCKAEGLFLLPAPTKNDVVTPDALKDFCQKAESFYDIIIFDFPAGIDFTLYEALPRKTVFICVATPDPVSVRDASFVGAKLSKLGLTARLIINRFNLKTHFKRKQKNIDGIIDASTIRLLGIVPESDEITLLSLRHRLKVRKKPFKAFLRISHRLLDKNIPLEKLRKI